jgi:hypothetical protein
VVQVIEGREQVDWKRHGVFVTFGFFYLVSFVSPTHQQRAGLQRSAQSTACCLCVQLVCCTAAAVCVSLAE